MKKILFAIMIVLTASLTAGCGMVYTGRLFGMGLQETEGSLNVDKSPNKENEIEMVRPTKKADVVKKEMTDVKVSPAPVVKNQTIMNVSQDEQEVETETIEKADLFTSETENHYEPAAAGVEEQLITEVNNKEEQVVANVSETETKQEEINQVCQEQISEIRAAIEEELQNEIAQIYEEYKGRMDEQISAEEAVILEKLQADIAAKNDEIQRMLDEYSNQVWNEDPEHAQDLISAYYEQLNAQYTEYCNQKKQEMQAEYDQLIQNAASGIEAEYDQAVKNATDNANARLQKAIEELQNTGFVDLNSMITISENPDDTNVINEFRNDTNVIPDIDSISVKPKHVYYENGMLIAECFVLNGYSHAVYDIEINDLSLKDAEGKIFAESAFGKLAGLTLGAGEYVVWTFIFDADDVLTEEADLRGITMSSEYCCLN